MLPEITDRLITRTVQSQRMFEAGKYDWTRGLVGPLAISADPVIVSAEVRDGARQPHVVEVKFGSGGAIAASDCTCPGGTPCKHVAAVLFALRDAKTAKSATAAPAPVATDLFGQRLAPARTLPALPSDLSMWASAMTPLLRAATAPARRQERAIIYIVSAQAMTGNQRMSQQRTAAALAPPGVPLRLRVDVVDSAIDLAGRPVGGSSGDSGISHLILHASESRAAHVEDEDRLLVRRLEARAGETDRDGCLCGPGGRDLLDRMIATGRARWGSVRGPALHAAPAVSGELRWRHDDRGHAILALATDSADAIVGVVAPPLAIDETNGAVAAIEAGLPDRIVEQMLRVPAVAPDAIDALAARWHDLAPPRVPPPPHPEIAELGLVTPVPVLVLRIERLTLITAARNGQGREYEEDRPVARLAFDYGVAVVDAMPAAAEPVARDGGALVRFCRDFEAEAAALARLVRAGLAPLNSFDRIVPHPRQRLDHIPHAAAKPIDFVRFLMRDADAMRAEGWRITLDPAFPLRLHVADPESLAADYLPAGIDWFDIALGATIDGERIDLVPALRTFLKSIKPAALRALLDGGEGADDQLPVALGDGRVVLLETARVLPMLRAMLLLAAHDPDATGNRYRISSRELGLVAELETATHGLTLRGAEPLRDLSRALTDLSFAPTQLPDGFKATLRPYQQTGLDWLEALDRAGYGGLLADDMGLGKTVQTLAHIATLKARGGLDRPVLIVAPTSVLPNWHAETARFAPGLSTMLLHGPDRRDRHAAIAAHDIVFTSYPILVRDTAALARENFALVVFDEAHNLKNPRTASHAAAGALIADRMIALTGTPVENRLTDAWALFELIVPGLLGSERAFMRDYRGPIEKQNDSDAKARLARKLRPFLLRRTKEAVAIDLPPKSIVPLAITLDPAQMALLESQRLLMQARIRDEIERVGLMRAQIVMLSALTRLRQICCDPRLIGDLPGGRTPPSAKLERLLELLDEMMAEGRRVILFSQFTSMLDLIKPELDQRGIAWAELTGKTQDRKTPVARFQAGKVPLILISLKAGGTGLNLTAADTVLLYDPWWNPAVEAQAIDRAHRIGQTKPVFVYRMIAAGTIEEKILALQARKSALAEALWSDDVATPAALTEDDIAFLLG